MRFPNTALVVLVVGVAACAAQAAHTQARLLLGAEAARPGDTVLVGVQLRMDPGWHTYWKNAGDSGIPSEIHWQLAAGIATNDIQWAVPEKLVEKELTTYIYTGEVVLLVPLKLASDLPPGPVTLKAEVSWLECQVLCVPGKANVQATLVVGPEAKPSKDAASLAAWQKRLPKSAAGLAARASWDTPPVHDSRRLLVEWKPAGPVQQADFFPDPSSEFEVEAPTETLAVTPEKVLLRKEVKKLEGDWPKSIAGVLIQSTGTDRLAYQVNLPLGKAAATTAGTTASGMPGPSVWLMLVYGFLGGLILNVMPCVLPVIALKILGFVGQAKEEPRRVRMLGLIYTLGVMVSFLVLAALVIGIKAAGHQAGWGMQFSNPIFLVALTVLVTLVALNLFGLYEVNPGGRVLSAAGAAASKKGAAGAFFNGVLATVLATPCTAPFLSIALGFAFAQSTSIILLTLLAVGLGLASPYLALSWHPGWLKFLPKPGPWMERFKIAMGFPMLATALWLLSLLPGHYGERAWWLGLFLVIVALAAWVYGEFVQRGRSRRALGAVVAVGLLIAGYWLILEGALEWRSPAAPRTASSGARDQPRGIDWQPWSPMAIAAARTEGRPILVDFTADWCLTCNSLVKPALENSSVRDKLRDTGTVCLLGDYTHTPQAITDELSRFGRAGVPLVLVYPKDPQAAPMVLPEPAPLSLPSHYSRVILEALTRASL